MLMKPKPTPTPTPTIRIIPIIVLVALAGWFPMPGNMWPGPITEAVAAHDNSGPLTLDDAVAKIRKETGGKVLTADEESSDGETRFRIKVLLSGGRVRVYYVDATNGVISK